MAEPDALLAAALRAAPRRYRMPPLPPDTESARAAGGDTALAFAIEALRLAHAHGAGAPAGVRTLFTQALATRIRAALSPQEGDPAFQALLLRTQDGTVREHVRLAAHASGDRRSVRALVDAAAHPGKLRAMTAGPQRDALAALHALSAQGEWTQLLQAAGHAVATSAGDPLVTAALHSLLTSPALARLAEAALLLQQPAVQDYQALCALSGPRAGSQAAAAQGRSSARRGELAEEETVRAFAAIAQLLGAPPHRVVRGLRTPRGYPGTAGQGKEEWDVALVRELRSTGAADIVLLAEVKAAPAAATPDWARLLRGLQRLSVADGDAAYDLPVQGGTLRAHGASLRALAPQGHDLPWHVIYSCSAPPEPQPAMLSAASRAVLLAEPASLAFAAQVQDGATPPDSALDPVWEALAHAPRLRATLHQYDTSRRVRAAMLHPADLLAAVAQALAAGRPH